MSTPPTSKMTALTAGARSPAIGSGAVSKLALRQQANRASIHPDTQPTTRLWNERSARPRAHKLTLPLDVPAVNGDRASVHLRVQHGVSALWQRQPRVSSVYTHIQRGGLAQCAIDGDVPCVYARLRA